MPDTDPIIQPNLIRPSYEQQATDIAHELYEVLKKHEAMLLFRQQERAMLLMVPKKLHDFRSWQVIALVKAITPLGAVIDRGVFKYDQTLGEVSFSDEDTANIKRMMGKL